MKPQLVTLDAGRHNDNLEESGRRIMQGGSWKKQRIVVIIPAAAQIPTKAAMAIWSLAFPPNQGVYRLAALGMEVGEAYSNAIEGVLSNPELSQWEYILTVENGTVLEFDEAGAMIGERLPGGYVFVAGTSVGDVGPAVLREREALSSSGVVVVSFKWNYALREMAGPPEISSRGFVYEKEAGDLMAGAVDRLTQALRETNRVGKRGLDEAAREALGRYFYERVGRRPTIMTAIMDA